MNVHTTEAFRQVFESIFHSIEEVTGRPWTFGILCRERMVDSSPTLTVTADMEAAPILALGEILKKRLENSSREDVDQIFASRSPEVWPPPLEIVVQAFIIVCNVHWKRSILPLVHELASHLETQTKSTLQPLLTLASSFAAGEILLPSPQLLLEFEEKINDLKLEKNSDLRRLWEFPLLDSPDEIAKFWQFAREHQIGAVSRWASHKLAHFWISAGVNPSASLIPQETRRLALPRGGTNALEGSHYVEDLDAGTYKRLIVLAKSRERYDREKDSQFSIQRSTGLSSLGPGQQGAVQKELKKQRRQHSKQVKQALARKDSAREARRPLEVIQVFTQAVQDEVNAQSHSSKRSTDEVPRVRAKKAKTTGKKVQNAVAGSNKSAAARHHRKEIQHAHVSSSRV
ncbi:hypothetical protein JCM5350_007009 [Sporobolomyces pararoseus]